jgi:CRISPR/Cas system CSM-associated protein Csm3 (group 7 of RAMP superfamily)
MSAQWLNARRLRERLVVTGVLTLETPTHVGNGDEAGLLDMPIHVDALEGRPLLPGAGLAGALRHYVAQYDATLADQIFGYAESVLDEGEGERVMRSRSVESLLLVDDALGYTPDNKLLVELRDGVAIDPATRTAEDDKKFDIELLAAGTQFALSFELQIREEDDRTALVQALALALHGLENGAIRLGKRKRRGFGRCRAGNWQVQSFNLRTWQGMAAWLSTAPAAPAAPPTSATPDVHAAQSIFALLQVAPVAVQPFICTVDAYFRLDGSLLIRSLTDDAAAADAVHLRSWRQEGDKRIPQPVVSGTSLAGALRARALRIANTVGRNGVKFIDDLFGYRVKDKQDKTKLTASRLWVEETEIKAPQPLVQSRVKIDRFTGGSFPGALFSEEAAWGTPETRVNIKFNLQALTQEEQQKRPRHQDAEIGLLLLLLKDLWTGDLPLGGGSSVGRGRLRGEYASVIINEQKWTFQADPSGRLVIAGGPPAALEHYVQWFLEEVTCEK